MEAKRLMKVTYQDLKKGIRLNAYADAVIWSEDPSPTLAGLRFGGYAEVVRGLTDAIYGGATIEIEDADGSLLTLKSLSCLLYTSHRGNYLQKIQGQANSYKGLKRFILGFSQWTIYRLQVKWLGRRYFFHGPDQKRFF